MFCGSKLSKFGLRARAQLGFSSRRQKNVVFPKSLTFFSLLFSLLMMML
jgi:hypothetical protein